MAKGGSHTLLLLVAASYLLHSYAVSCNAQLTHRRPLPVRTYVQDASAVEHPNTAYQSKLQAFAVYQEVHPSLRSYAPPHIPTTRMCQHDSLGSFAWPPTAVCWSPAPLHTPEALQPHGVPEIAASPLSQSSRSVPQPYLSSSDAVVSDLAASAVHSHVSVPSGQLAASEEAAALLHQVCLLNGSAAFEQKHSPEQPAQHELSAYGASALVGAHHASAPAGALSSILQGPLMTSIAEQLASMPGLGMESFSSLVSTRHAHALHLQNC